MTKSFSIPASDAKKLKSHCLTSWCWPNTIDWGYDLCQQTWKEYAKYCDLLSFLQMLLYQQRTLKTPTLCWQNTAQTIFSKRLELPRSVISIIIYPIPSDLGSQDDSSQASSTVGDHVRSPGTERFSSSIASFEVVQIRESFQWLETKDSYLHIY